MRRLYETKVIVVTRGDLNVSRRIRRRSKACREKSGEAIVPVLYREGLNSRKS